MRFKWLFFLNFILLPSSWAQTYWVYVGSYARSADEGITLCDFDAKTGELRKIRVFPGIENPSFLTIHPSGRFLYACNETATTVGKKGGAVSSFSIDPETGNLTKINQALTQGGGPCHLTLDPKGKSLFVANYGGGSVISFPISKDGRIGKSASFFQHAGSSVNPRRQEGPHAHSINPDPSGKRVFSADLGLDQVLVYRLLPKGRLAPNDPPFVKTAPGGGPRHLSFHPSGKFAYVNLEMTSEISVFKHDPDSGRLEQVQTVSTLPAGYSGNNSTAEIRVHPSGNFVYCSNRGHDSIVVFAIDPKTGLLSYVEHQSSGGRTPRNFCLDPSGSFLLTANQNSNDVHVFKVDRKTGKLEPTGSSVDSPRPVCVRFVAKP
jgi:6-phosphogluconolactonase